MTPTQEQIRNIVTELGARGAEFQSRQVRERLGVDPSSRSELSYIHNFLKALIRDGVIEVVSSKRKRNKRLKLTQLDRTGGPAEATSASPKSPASQTKGPIDRLTRIENTLAAVDRRLAAIELQLEQLLAIWQ